MSALKKILISLTVFAAGCTWACAADASDVAALRDKAMQGNAVAQYTLGTLLATDGTPQTNRAEAYVWLKLAAENGADAKELSQLLDRMSPAELSEGMRKFDEIRAKVPPSANSAAASATPPAEDVGKLTAERDQLVQSLNSATTELAALRAAQAKSAALAAASSDTSKLQQQLAAANATVAQLTQQVTELKSSLADKAAALQQAQAEAAATKPAATQAADLGALQAQITSLTADRDLLHKQLDEAQDAARKDADLRERLARAERDAELLKTQNKELTADHEKSKSAAPSPDDVKKLADLTASVAQLTQENAQLKQQLAATPAPAPAPAPTAAPSDASGDTVANLKAQLAQTQDKLDTALRSYTLQQQDLDAARAAASKAAEDSEAKLTALQTENASLKDQLSAATSAGHDRDAALTAAQQEITQLRAKAITQGMEATSLRDQLRQTQAQLAVFAEENAQLKTKLAVALPPPSSTYAAPARPGTAAAQTAITLPPALTPEPVATQPVPAPAAAGRQHIVVPGDTLSKLSQRYYGTPYRWRRIYDANRDIIGNPNSLPMGASLRIP